MFIIGYFLSALATIIYWVLNIYFWIILARVVFSWVNPDPYNQVVRFVYNVTEPVLYRIRALLPLNFGGLDLSPIVVFLGITFLKVFLVNSLTTIAQRLLY